MKRYRVRCIYLSADGELLAIDSRELSQAAATKLVRRCERPDSEVLEAYKYNVNRPPWLGPGIRLVPRLTGRPELIAIFNDDLFGGLK